MKRIKLFHDRVFNDQDYANFYYEKRYKSIQKMGKRIAGILKKSGLTGGKILDVGCGFCAIPIEIAKAIPNCEIIGVDLSEPLLNIGQNLINEAGYSDRITLQKGDAHQLQFEDQSFDVVINTFLLHLVENPISLLNEIERVAKPSAKIIITDLRRMWLGWFVKKLKTALTLEEAMNIIKQSNIRPGQPSKGSFWWDYMVEV